MVDTLILFRHGDVEHPYDEDGVKLSYGPSDPLSDVGHIQMQSLAHKLKTDGIIPDVIYSSPFIRALQSTQYLSREFVLPMAIEEDLRDVHVPGYYGRPWNEIVTSGGNTYSLPPRSEDQETLSELVDRARVVVSKLMEKKEGKTIAIVSHGDFMCAINWILREEGYPESYSEMLKRGYPAKGEAMLIRIDEAMNAIGEGRIISTPESAMTIEGFRGNPERR